VPERRLHPSKALLHVAAVMDEAEHMGAAGVSFAKPTVDVDALRAHKDKVVGKLTGGLAGMAKGRKVDIIRGYGHFLDPNHIEVEETTGTSQDKTGAKKVVKFKQASSPPARPRCICPSSPATRASSIPLARWSCASYPASCWSSAAVHRPGNGHRLFLPGARVDVVEMMDA
jgi:hypothetical protein